MEPFSIGLVVIVAYFAGSVPFGLLLAKLLGYGDIRQYGSGNIGATNALRVGGKVLGILTFVLDGLKGWLPARVFGCYYDINVVAISGLFSVLWDIAPIWLRFQGGKGVSVTLAVFVALNIWVGCVAIALWISIFILTRMSSLASLISIGIATILSFFIFKPLVIAINLSIFMLILYKHRKNIVRIINGVEFIIK